MNLSIGIVGLPNVGKSTLFNALLKKQQALVANYPFATIEPNVGVVPVPDERLEKLAEITKTEEKMSDLPPIKPATGNFIDIAGLVKGANEGAGLGNKFLSHVRKVDAIIEVVRIFEDPNMIHVHEKIDPLFDIEVINMELELAGIKKPTLYVLNTSEIYKSSPNATSPQPSPKEREVSPFGGGLEGGGFRTKIPGPYIEIDPIFGTGLDNLIKASYDLLNLITFFTTGE